MLPGFLMILVSVGWYALQNDGLQSPVWQVHHFDHADYRFLAEHFWHIPHDLSTYAPEFAGSWGEYLTRVPFRDIGVGTYYLVNAAFYGMTHGLPSVHPDQLATWIPASLILLLCAAYIAFYVVCKKRAGTLYATICLLALLTIPGWTLTHELISEPFLRICFVLLLTLTLSIETIRRSVPALLALSLVLLLTMHIKAQWLLLAPLMSVALLLSYRRDVRSAPVISVLLLMFILPLTLMMIHTIGWGTAALTPGKALHMNLKTDGAYVEEFCVDHPTSTVCNPSSDIQRDGWWRLPLGNAAPVDELNALDSGVTSSVLSNPVQLLKDIWSGVMHTTNFPDSLPRNPFLLLLDLLTVLFLIVGLWSRRTALPAATALGLWIIPIIANIFAVYDPRYYRPMAGLPLAIAILIACMLFDPASNIKKSCLRSSMH